jgi:hypothetical protein
MSSLPQRSLGMSRRGEPPIAQSNGDIEPGIIQTAGAEAGAIPIRLASAFARCCRESAARVALRIERAARTRRMTTRPRSTAATLSHTEAVTTGQLGGRH